MLMVMINNIFCNVLSNLQFASQINVLFYLNLYTATNIFVLVVFNVTSFEYMHKNIYHMIIISTMLQIGTFQMTCMNHVIFYLDNLSCQEEYLCFFLIRCYSFFCIQGRPITYLHGKIVSSLKLNRTIANCFATSLYK